MNLLSNTFATLLEQSNGRFVTLSFIKKDGTSRTINCRIGVTKHLKGGRKTVDESKFVTVYDVQRKGYRCINRNTITSISINGEHATIGA